MILYYQLNKPPNLPTYLCKSLLLHYQPTYLPTYQPTNQPTYQPTNLPTICHYLLPQNY